MDRRSALHALLGLDIGCINTRASYFGILEEKFRMLACGIASSSLGYGMQPGSGAGASMRNLQTRSEVHILKPNGELIWPYYDLGLGVDRIAVTISGGPNLRTVLLGLTTEGSLKAGIALIESLALSLVGSFGLKDLIDESDIVDKLVELRPDVIVLTGGENGGADKPIRRWIDILKLVCLILPKEVNPHILFTGNAVVEPDVKRHLEPLAKLTVVPNIGPMGEDADFAPAFAALDKIIIKQWEQKISGFKELTTRTNADTGTKSFAFGRMIRYLGDVNKKTGKGVMAVDLGGCVTTLAVGSGTKAGTLRQLAWDGLSKSLGNDLIEDVYQWTAASVTLDEVKQHLYNCALNQQTISQEPRDMAISRAYARVRLKLANQRFVENYSWFSYKSEKGLMGHFEPIIASGAIFTQSSSPGLSMLMLIDGLQPWGVTTIVLDRYHILPILGVVASREPVLPTHVLASDVFESLGSVVTVVSSAPQDEVVLNVNVKTSGGKDYDVEILQGSLRRLVIPSEVTAELILSPTVETDIGFGGQGAGGRLKVPGGRMGVVIDARGRPLQLPEEDDKRVDLLKHWELVLGG